MLGLLLIICTSVFLLAILYSHYSFPADYWKKRGVPGPEPLSFIGTIKDVVLRTITFDNYLTDLYKDYRKEPLVGFFQLTQPLLVINDPELIRDILITDSSVFSERGIFLCGKISKFITRSFTQADSSGESSVYHGIDIYQSYRSKLTACLTSRKIRSMPRSMGQRWDVFKVWLDALVRKNKCLNCDDVAIRLIVRINVAFFLDCEVIDATDEETALLRYMQEVLSSNCQSLFRIMARYTAMPLYEHIGHYVLARFLIKRELNRMVENITRYRHERSIARADFLQATAAFRQIFKYPGGTTVNTKEHFTAYIITLLQAIYDGPIAVMGNVLLDLASNPCVQDKLRIEVRKAYAETNGDLTIDKVNEMRYLDAVFKETIRLHPPTSQIRRKATSAYTFRNLQTVIPKGQVVFIPTKGIHHDPEIYPNPEVYDPERFLGDAARFRHSYHCTIYHSVPFGDHLKGCPGERLGVVEAKTAIILLLLNHRLDVCERTKISNVFKDAKDIYLTVTKSV